MVYTSGVRSDGNYRGDEYDNGRQNEYDQGRPNNGREVFYNDRHPESWRDEREEPGLLDGISSIFRKLKTDDLLIIGLGLVLLLDGNKDNDLLLIVLLMLLFD